jgi:hypothetical protein
MSALRALVAPLSHDGRFFAGIEVRGSHRASLTMVAPGEADVAAIDCVIHALLARYRPAALAGTRPLGWTPGAPAPPFVIKAEAGEPRFRMVQPGARPTTPLGRHRGTAGRAVYQAIALRDALPCAGRMGFE